MNIILTEDIRSLTDFQRNTKVLVQQIKQTGRPMVLTVNGKAELVVQDAESYQRLLELVKQAETLVGGQRGPDDGKCGGTLSLREGIGESERRDDDPIGS